MPEKIPVNNFEQIENTSQFNGDSIKSYSEESNKGNIVEVDVQYTEKLHELHNGLSFLAERM